MTGVRFPVDAAGEVPAAHTQVPTLRMGSRVVMADGGMEAIKWLALVLMTLDHINKYLLQSQVEWMFSVGRVVMPLFSCVLAYNLARPVTRSDASGTGAALSAAKRIACVALISAPVSWALNGPWPLNILFMLAGSAWVISLLQKRRAFMAWTVAILSGSLVEFWWPAIGATVAAWYFFKCASWQALAAWIACLWVLTLVNGNLWAFGAVPVIWLVGRRPIKISRQKWFFYGFYPAHLAIIWMVSIKL